MTLSLVYSSCDPKIDTTPEKGTLPEAVLMRRSELEKSVKVEGPRKLHNPGKIYSYGTWLFVCEKYEGIHVYDNLDPTKPINKSFLVIPGCQDMAVKNFYLYADNAVDLVTFHFLDLNQIELVDRERNAFPEILPPNYTQMPTQFDADHRPDSTIIIAWK
ncbi:MAG: hypothetical protein GC180_00460 [Bacteroidetes bacterium]|nr:hypothetical protein [Bacteroidota bacterium]